MLATEIKRIEMVVPIGATDQVADLAGDAESLLGYSVLKENLDPPVETPTLARVLAQLGIETLNRVDVIRYMRERLCDRTLELMDEWQKTVPDPLRSWSNFSGPTWVTTDISKYKEPIPEFVLNKAIQIKRELPDVGVYIYHLTEAKDPFLLVTYGATSEYDFDAGERYFVEVWEEPRFEGRVR